MHGDFSLNPTHYRDRVSRVLQQMGRVQLDSDWNEQTESTLRFLRGLGADVIGAHGGLGNGFKIIPETEDPTKSPFRVAWGHYYVDGIRCVNMPPMDFWDVIGDPELQKKLGDGLRVTAHADSYWPAKDENPDRVERMLYLAVWERHISSAEDDSIREVALLGPDTASRAVVTWQVRYMPSKPVIDLAKTLKIEPWDPNYLALNLLLRSSARMKARAIINQKLEPCTISPEARYRGAENRLYRVEIHDFADPATDKPATFKWSQDNAAIVYPVRAPIDGKTVKLESLGRDERTAIKKNDWVEVVDDEITLRRKVNPLLQVLEVDRHRMTVTLSDEPADKAGDDPKRNPILRRWAAPPEFVKENQWIELSDGVEVQFSHVETPKGGYRTGDYWLIPTRTATGDVLWPGPVENPEALAPHGVDEHYAPLALWGAAVTAGGGALTDLRWKFDPLAKKV